MEVVTWSPGHGGLLLRTRPGEPLAPDQPFERVEICFKPADVIFLPAHLDGITVDEVEPHEEVSITLLLKRDLHPWENAYVISTNSGPVGWVVGGSVNGRADWQPFDAPTMFDGRSAPSGVTELFAHNCS